MMRIWIDLNQKSFLLKKSKESIAFGLNVLVFITIDNSIVYIIKNGRSVRGYKVVGAQTEILNINSVIEIRGQINKQREQLMLSKEVNMVIQDVLDGLSARLRANEVWNSRYIARANKDVLIETSLSQRWERLQFKLIKRWIDSNDRKIIDAPSGSGRFSIALACEYPEAHVLGVDLLPQALALAEQGARLQNVTNIRFQRADLLVLPEILRYQTKFDISVSIGLLQNLTKDDLLVFVETLVQIVKPGGKVIISVPNGQSPIYRLWKVVLGENLKYRFGLERNVHPQEVIKALTKCGVEEIELEGFDPLYGLRKMYQVDPKTGNAIPFWWSKYSRALGQLLNNYFIDPLDRVTQGRVSRQFGNDFIVKGKIPVSLRNTPIGVRVISSDIDSGYLREIVEDQFRAVIGQQGEDGEKLVFYDRLATKYDLEFPLSSRGEFFKIRFFLQKPEEQIERIPRNLPLLRLALSESINETFDVFPRRKIYADKHLILCSSGQHHIKQSMYLDGLNAGLRFLKGMGPGYSGFFNAATPTTDTFHYQFFGDSSDPWPIWQNLENGLLGIEGEQRCGVSDVSMANLSGWPISAPIFQSTDPDSLANAIWQEINPTKLSENISSDLIFNHAQDGRLQVILILRDRVGAMKKPKTFYPEDPDTYGTFGGMEYAGIILMQWKDQVVQSLRKNPELTAERLRKALEETTIPFIV